MSASIDKAVVCVVGLGYVGLPLARAFARSLRVIAFDTSQKKIKSLKKSDSTPKMSYTSNPGEIAGADFYVICVPTPVTESKLPDLSYVKSAAETVGRNMKRGATVVLESTVYPGVTEEVVKPILEKASGLECGSDFKIGYSPERINPGDDEHTIERVTKVVAGMDRKATELIAKFYARVTPKVFKAKSIKIAEASKVVENSQRDLNIALMNELAMIFNRMGLSTRDILDTAATKWNFHRYAPGLVGGYCIPVVPYYLVHRAKELGYDSRIIKAGRAVNEYMPRYVAGLVLRTIKEAGKPVSGAKVLVMGLTYKKNVAEPREAPVWQVIRELAGKGIRILAFDPLLSPGDLEAGFSEREFKLIPGLEKVGSVDGVLVAVAHDIFKPIALTRLKSMMPDKPVLVDIGGLYDRGEAEEAGFSYVSL